MNARILLAGVVAGIALFAWESVAHLATPLGTAGFKTFPDEAGMMAVIKATSEDSGLYLYPAPKADGSMPANTPAGILLMRRHGLPPMGPAQLGGQLAIDIAAMLLAAMIVARMGAAASLPSQLLIVLALSLFPTLRSGGPMWIWYGYPKKYVAAQLAIDVIGFGIAGFIVAKLVRAREKAKTAAV